MTCVDEHRGCRLVVVDQVKQAFEQVHGRLQKSVMVDQCASAEVGRVRGSEPGVAASCALAWGASLVRSRASATSATAPSRNSNPVQMFISRSQAEWPIS